MKKIQKLIFPLTILLLLLLINRNIENNNTFFIDIKEAKQTSLLEDKPLLIIFDQSISDEVKQISNIKDYVICLLEYEKNRSIFEEYQIKKIPSYVVVDNRTNVIYKEEGRKNKKFLLEWLKSTNNKIRMVKKQKLK